MMTIEYGLSRVVPILTFILMAPHVSSAQAPDQLTSKPPAFDSVTLLAAERGWGRVEQSPRGLFWGDYNSDGLSDVLVVQSDGACRLFENVGDGTFQDRTVTSCLATIKGCVLAMWSDVTMDGRQDLLLVTSNGACVLLRNSASGIFEDITALSGLYTLKGLKAAGWIDYDQDGAPDLLAYTVHGEELWHNQGAAVFRRILTGRVPMQESLADTREQDKTGRRTTRDETSTRAADEAGAGPRNTNGPIGGRVPITAPSGAWLARGSGPQVGVTPGPGAPAPGFCADTIRDQAIPTNCIPASSVATLGALYPISSEFFIDPLGLVGINTVVPNATVHVVPPSSGGFANLLLVDNGTARGSGAAMKVVQASDKQAVHIHKSSTGAGAALRIINDGTGPTIDAGNALWLTADGRLGLGTSAPSAMLDVAGQVGMETALVRGGTSGVALRVEQNSSSPALSVLGASGSGTPVVEVTNPGSSTTLVLKDSGGDVFTVSADGTTMVRGDLAVIQAGPGFRDAIKAVDGAGSGVDADYLDGLDAAAFAASAHGHSFSDISGVATDAQVPDIHTHSANSIPAAAIADGSGSGLDADKLDGLESSAFASVGHGHAGLWSANGSDLYHVGGSVGIGTSSPGAPLHVKVSSSVAAILETTNTSATALTVIGNGGRGVWAVESTNTAVDAQSGAGRGRPATVVARNTNGDGTNALYAENTSNGSTIYPTVYARNNSGKMALFADGDSGASGTKYAVVPTRAGTVGFTVIESTEVWFEDIGEGELVNGRAHVELDPVYLDAVTVDGQNPMQIFVQVLGDCNGVYVERQLAGFDVVELRGGRSNVGFSYRVAAKRRGYEEQRLKVLSVADPVSGR